MGGLAPGKLKSRRGWPSSPRRLIHGCYFFDPGFKNSLREKLYQLCGNGDTLIAIDSRRPGLFWSANVALSFAATGKPGPGLDAQPLAIWAAGAGLSWVLARDTPTVP